MAMRDSAVEGENAVDVWAVRLSAPAEATRTLRSLLSSGEIQRADRFLFEHLTTSFVIAHGVLRLLLSEYLRCGPRDIEYTTGKAGKPALRGDSRFRFNMSHSGSMALYAFTSGCEAGVDVEEVRGVPDLEQIARRYFCPAESAELMSLAGEEERQAAFFRCWTRKESYIKAVGDGLSIPLDQFQVTLLPAAPARLVEIAGDAEAAREWTLHHLEPAPGYVGALAYRDRRRKVAVHPPREAGEILALAGGGGDLT